MTDYRLYLLRAGHIQAAETFAANDDAEALKLAALLYESCSDVFDGCEVWLNDHRIANLTALNYFHPVTLEEVVEATQQSLLELEDHLERSFSAIRASPKLLKASSRLRGRLGVVRGSSPQSSPEDGLAR